MLRSLKLLLLGVLSVHGFAPPAPRVDRRAVALNFDAATAAADILADPTARFEAATVVLLASFASNSSAEVKKFTRRVAHSLMSSQVEGRPEPLEAREEARETEGRVVRRLAEGRGRALGPQRPVE